ncbi:MAG: YigZ family protein [Halobacteria archaeon]
MTNGGDNGYYTTVADSVTTSFEVQGSEFLGHISPVQSVGEAEEFIEEVRSKYGDATHNVPAYRVRDDPLREWCSDDGEPSGSAGEPALNVLSQNGVENVVVVVTRYYGGTNLGYGGLVRAYSKSVKDALDSVDLIKEKPHSRVEIEVDYGDKGDVEGILESVGFDYCAEYTDTVVYDVSVPDENLDGFSEKLLNVTSGRAEIVTRVG